MSKVVTHYIYTDASFAHQQKTACIGFLVFRDQKSHAANIFANATLHTSIISEKNNIRAELRSFILAVNSVNSDPENKLTVYTDCQAISALLSRREKLQNADFKSLGSGKMLSNADLYQEFFALNDSVNWQIIWLKGHKAQGDRTCDDKNFRYLDQCVRKSLRTYLKNLKDI